MSSQAPHNSAASDTPATTGTIPQSLSSSAEAKTDWLANSLLTAKTITAAAECVPFSCVKGVFGTVVVLLETVEKLKKNRDNMKELCEDIVGIINVVQGLSVRGDIPAVEFKSRCDEFEGALQVIVTAVKKMQTKSQGLHSHFKEIVKLGSTTDSISGYRNRMQELRSNFMLMATVDTNLQIHRLHETFSAMTSSMLFLLDFSLPQITQITNNCPPPSRIFEGGAGKTQIALKFIEESYSHFSNTFFIDTSTIETIDAGLKNIVLTKNVGSTSEDALQWLRNKPDQWLLFFDNADDPKLNLNKFLPRCNHGNIVITSRNPELRGYAGAHHLVSDMEETDAVQLLLKSAAQNVTLGNEQTAAGIVKALWQGHSSSSREPLAHTWLYATNKDQLLREKPAQSHDDYAWTVYTTWQISFDQLSISEQIFSYASAYKFKPHGPTEEELQEPIKFLSQFLGPNGVWDSLLFMDLMTEIRSYSLINLDVIKQLYSIHPLVHDWSRTTPTHKESYHSCIVAIVGMSIAAMPRTNLQADSLKLLPHIDDLLNGKLHITPDFNKEYATIYYYARRHREAEKLELAVLSKCRTILGEDHPCTLSAMNDLASTYRFLGRLLEAEELQGIVLQKRMDILGQDHQDTLSAMKKMANTYHAMRKCNKAKKLQLVVLERDQRILGEDHPDTLDSMGHLANTYRALGQLEKAEKLQVVVIEKRKTVLGEDHPHTLTDMHNLAKIYHSLGKLEEAEEIHINLLRKDQKIYGEDHPDTLTNMHHLACTYHKMGKLEEAEKLQVVVVKKQKTVLGEEHPSTQHAMKRLTKISSALARSKKHCK
ncbi:hypothetical protein C8R44DRAFT_858062 [Mycena epipterygia]|nr:hypothetical protein C8R44DRAFT_858062 [Mycena epipterygia]